MDEGSARAKHALLAKKAASRFSTAIVVIVVVVVLTLTRILKSVVTGQAPVTLELRNTYSSTAVLPHTNRLEEEHKNYKIDSTDDKKRDQKNPVEKSPVEKAIFDWRNPTV